MEKWNDWSIKFSCHKNISCHTDRRTTKVAEHSIYNSLPHNATPKIPSNHLLLIIFLMVFVCFVVVIVLHFLLLVFNDLLCVSHRPRHQLCHHHHHHHHHKHHVALCVIINVAFEHEREGEEKYQKKKKKKHWPPNKPSTQTPQDFKLTKYAEFQCCFIFNFYATCKGVAECIFATLHSYV